MRRVAAILGIGAPNEARFFLFAGAFGIAVAVIYWFISYEHAGSALLLAFGGGTALVGVMLALAAPSGAPPDADRPYLDESGRIPSSTLAPFAVGVGLAIAATSIVFGPAPLLVGAPPLAWGVLAWLHRARAEFDAIDGDRDARSP